MFRNRLSEAVLRGYGGPTDLRFKIRMCRITISLFVGIALPSSATDWNIVQTANLTDNYNAVQENTNGGNQSVNTIALDQTTDSIGSASQMVNAEEQDLVLTQRGNAIQSSIQSLNAISAYAIDNASQDVTGFSLATLAQEVGAGNGNIQTLNYVQSESVTNLSQTITGTTVTMDNSATTGSNLQILNYLQPNTINVGAVVSQSVTLDTLNVTADSSYQGVNIIVSNTLGAATQNTTIENINYSSGGPVVLNFYAVSAP